MPTDKQSIWVDPAFGFLLVTDPNIVPLRPRGVPAGHPLAVKYDNGERALIAGWLIPVTVDYSADPAMGSTAQIEATPIPMVRTGRSTGYRDARSVYGGTVPFEVVAADGTESDQDSDDDRPLYLHWPAHVPDDISALTDPRKEVTE